MIRRSCSAVSRRISRHVVVGRRERILDAGFNHAGFPELGLKIQFSAIDIDDLPALDINPERVDAAESLVVVRLLEIDRTVIITVIVDINRQFALQGFGEGVGVVEVRRVLRGFESILGIGGTIRGVRALDHIGGVASGHNMLVHVHERHLKDETEGIERVDIPVVAYFEHVVLEIHGVIRIGIVLEERRLAVRLKINIILRKDLRELAECIGFLTAVVEHKRKHFLTQPALDITEIHAAITGRKHSVKALHHVALGLDIDDTTLPRGIVFSGRIRDNLYLLYRVAVRTVQHGFELLAGEVGRFAVHPNLDRFTVYGNIAVFVDADTRRATKDIVSVRTSRKRRSRDVHH